MTAHCCVRELASLPAAASLFPVLWAVREAVMGFALGNMLGSAAFSFIGDPLARATIVRGEAWVLEVSCLPALCAIVVFSERVWSLLLEPNAPDGAVFFLA